MKSASVLRLLRRLAAVGLLSCFLLFALTVTVHCHTAAMDHAQHACALCLIGLLSKACLLSLSVLPISCGVRALCIVATPHRVFLPFWDTTSSRAPPSLA